MRNELFVVVASQLQFYLCWLLLCTHKILPNLSIGYKDCGTKIESPFSVPASDTIALVITSLLFALLIKMLFLISCGIEAKIMIRMLKKKKLKFCAAVGISVIQGDQILL